MTLFRTAVEETISGIHKLLGTGGGPHLLDIVVLAMADGLFGLYGLERRDELLTGTPPLPFPLFLVPDKPYSFCGRKAPW